MPEDIIIKSTGEIVENVVRLVTEKQETFIQSILQISEANKEFNEKNGGFIFKEDSKQVDKLENRLTDSDLTKILYLATYLDYDSYLKYDNGKKLSKSDIKEIIGVNKNLFNTWYNKIVKSKIIFEDAKGIHMNKSYYLKGSINKRKDYNRLFINGIRQIYEGNKSINQSTIGSVIRLLPYVNAYTNVLCWNPLESDPEKISPITIGELAIGFGYGERNEKKLMKAISKIRVFDNHPLVIFFNDDDSISDNYLMFHPLISYSGKNENHDDVYKMFVLMANKNKDKNLIGIEQKKLIRRD